VTVTDRRGRLLLVTLESKRRVASHRNTPGSAGNMTASVVGVPQVAIGSRLRTISAKT
jgi:hypothetical protein